MELSIPAFWKAGALRLHDAALPWQGTPVAVYLALRVPGACLDTVADLRFMPQAKHPSGARFYTLHGAGLSGQALAETVSLVEARAMTSGEVRKPCRATTEADAPGASDAATISRLSASGHNLCRRLTRKLVSIISIVDTSRTADVAKTGSVSQIERKR